MTYQSTNLLARTNPLRSMPFMRPASILVRIPLPAPVAPVIPAAAPDRAYHVLTPNDLLATALANAEARLREMVRVYDFARAAIGEANRTSTAPVIAGGRVVMPAKAFTKERIRERKAYAFRLFNQRRGELARARRAVDAARSALGLPGLAIIAERSATKAAIRSSKRLPLDPIAQAALAI